MRTLTGAVCSENPEAVSDCFCEDGIYHDVFYGIFRGKENIRDLIKNYFYRDGCNFQWDIHDPISKGVLGYCRYIFSFESRLEGAVGKRTVFEGVSVVQFDGQRLDVATSSPSADLPTKKIPFFKSFTSVKHFSLSVDMAFVRI